MESLLNIFKNTTLLVAVLSWLIASLLKGALIFYFNRKLDISRMLGSGGMPSSHSAFVSALAVAVGMQVGFSSTQFAIAACFSIVVMYDAAGVRRAAGKQAKVINQIMEEIFQGKPIRQEELKELLGHTPVEVFAGGLLGILVGLFFPY